MTCGFNNGAVKVSDAPTSRSNLGITNVATQSVTQYNTLVGGAANAITSVAPSSTSGVPLISQGASADPTYGTAVIAGGGTNATSMSTSTGIVKYDGTRLVTSSTALIDSSNRMINTAQPVFSVFVNTKVNDVTGDGTTYTIIFNSTIINQGTSYNTGTGIFTAPVTGNYLFTTCIGMDGITSSHTIALGAFSGSRYSVRAFQYAGIGTGIATGGTMASNASWIINMVAADTMKVTIAVYGSTKVVDVWGNSTATDTQCCFTGSLLC